MRSLCVEMIWTNVPIFGFRFGLTDPVCVCYVGRLALSRGLELTTVLI